MHSSLLSDCESDWDLKTCHMITSLFCLFIFLLSTRFLLIRHLLSLFLSFLFLLKLPFAIFTFLSSLSFLLAHLLPFAGWRQIALSKEGNKDGGQQILLSFPRHNTHCVCVLGWVGGSGGGGVAHCWTLDSRVICFPVTACDPKNHEWSPVDCWPGACCRRPQREITASSVCSRGQGTQLTAKCSLSCTTYYQLHAFCAGCCCTEFKGHTSDWCFFSMFILVVTLPLVN